MGVQRGNGLLRRLNFRRISPQCLCDRAVVAPTQLCQEPGSDVHGIGNGLLLAAELKHQALR